jgi:hypothetical protein
MAQKANLTLVDKYESDRGEAERLDLDKLARLKASKPVSAIQPAPTAEHQRRQVAPLIPCPSRRIRRSPRTSASRPGPSCCMRPTERSARRYDASRKYE